MVVLSEKEINDIKIYFFCIYDKKNRGSIEINDKENIFLHDALLNSFYYLGIKIKEKEIEEIIKDNNFNINGLISFDKFINIIENQLNDMDTEKDIKKYFNILSDGKDFILAENLKELLNDECNEKEVEEMIFEISNEDNKIYYEMFCKIFNKIIK